MKRRVASHDQHFLRSPRVAAILLGHSTIRRRDTVYDLGAGSGVITSALARRCQQVVAVENEPRALDALRRHTAAVPHVRIIAADIRQLTLPTEPYKVFANIPFALSADIVRMLTTASTPPKAIYLIVQRQFASKLVPSDRHFTAALGAQLAPWWQARIRYRLRRTDFTPPPAVDTVLLELLPRTEPWLPRNQQAAYSQFVAAHYAKPRRFAALPRAQLGINPERKPSELQPRQWVQLYQAMQMK